MTTATATEIKLLQKQRTLWIKFDDGVEFTFTCEFLRRHSPSAEVKGHGGVKSALPPIDPNINITQIEPVGNYAVKLVFDDGHKSGLFSWDYLYSLAQLLND